LLPSSDADLHVSFLVLDERIHTRPSVCGERHLDSVVSGLHEGVALEGQRRDVRLPA
jgi:hypothetical protein